jgi:hypothetical protein
MLNVCNFSTLFHPSPPPSTPLQSAANVCTLKNGQKRSFGQKFIDCLKSEKTFGKNKQTALFLQLQLPFLSPSFIQPSLLQVVWVLPYGFRLERKVRGYIKKQLQICIHTAKTFAFMRERALHRCTISIVLFRSAGSV